MTKKADFSLEEIKFPKIGIDFDSKVSNDINVSFDPKGVFNSDNASFELRISFKAITEDKAPFVEMDTVAIFQFDETTTFEDIPDYFYGNSIAIVFPYIRAFISTISLQSNVSSIILPLMNLSSLQQVLIDNTSIHKD